MATDRIVVGRLSTHTEYRPCRSLEAGRCEDPPRPGSPRYAEIASWVARNQIAEPGALRAEVLHERGIALLVLGTEEGVISSVAALEDAAQLAPSDAKLWADLVAARIALAQALDARGRAAEGQAAVARLEALEDALHAAKISNRDPQVRFNLALAFAEIGLPDQSEELLSESALADLGFGWGQELRRRLAALDAHLPDDSGPPPDAPALLEWARRWPASAQKHAERDLLRLWAEGADGNAAASAAALAKARSIAALLFDGYSDGLLSEATAAIDRADVRLRSTLVEAHRLYGSGIDAYGTQQFAVGRSRFEEAARLFAEAKSPMALWARYFVAVCAYGESRMDEASSLLHELDQAAGYPYLETRRLWMLNLTSGGKGQYSAAVEWGEKALELIEDLDDPSGRISMRLNLAGALVRLSRDEEAWGHRLVALRESARLGNRRVRHNALSEMIATLMELGRAELALPFVRSANENARAWDNRIAILEVGAIEAAVLAELGRRDEAVALLEECERIASDHPDEKLVMRLKADLAVERAALLAASEPASAMALLSSAAESYGRLELPVPSIRVHRMRSRAAVESGQSRAAEEALLEAIEVHRAFLRDQTTSEDRRGYLGEARRAYEALIALRAGAMNDPDGAFLAAEEYRLAFLDQAAPDTAAIADLRDGMPPGAAIVSYELLDDHVLAWVITRQGTSMVPLRVPRQELQRLVAVHQIEIRQLRQAPAEGSATSRLYEELWRPLAVALRGRRSLMIVPDPEIGWVGFSGLWNGRGRNYLAAEVDQIVLAPAASISRREPTNLAAGRFLVIGDPAFDRPSFPTLARLPKARSEAESIAERLPGATLLVGEQATAGRILSQLSGHSALHFAGHYLPGQEGGSLVVAPGAGADGLMTWADVEGSGVEHLKLVVLSTCSAGRTESWRQRRMGLTEHLLVGGVGAVVASPFEVDDRQGSRILFQFYDGLSQGLPPATALHAAKRAALDEPPASWVPFDLYGSSLLRTSDLSTR